MNIAKRFAPLTLLAVSTSLLAACASQPTALSPAQGVRQFNSNAAASASSEVVPGQVIVKYRSGVRGASAQVASSLSRMGGQRSSAIGTAMTGIDVYKLGAGQSVDSAVAALKQNPAVEYAEPVFTVPFPTVQRSEAQLPQVQPASFPNDAMFPRQYSHQLSQSQGGWAVTRGNPRIIIGIVDSGVDVTHPDLKGKIIDTYNGADNNKDVTDVIGHGTHVAGISAAMTNNGLGVAGVAPDCGILAVKVSSGTSSSPSTAGIANGVIWAADHGANVINLSLGARRESQVISDAVRYALSKNVVVVAATGNDSGNIMSYPAVLPGVVAVGATDSKDVRARYSNYGRWVSVTAPGSDILSTFPLNTNLIGQKEYGAISGTSMATPFVTGLVALIRSKYPTMPAAMVKQVLESSADDKGVPGFDDEYGHGRVNVTRALARAKEMTER